MSIDSVEQEGGIEAAIIDEDNATGDFEVLIDVPYITLNRVGGEYQAEVIMEGTDADCMARVDWILGHAEIRGMLCTSMFINEDNDAILMEFSNVLESGK